METVIFMSSKRMAASQPDIVTVILAELEELEFGSISDVIRMDSDVSRNRRLI